MPRVSQDAIDKLNAFIDSLPQEARNKCALCSETLTHIVKTAEAQTGAPTATVTRMLADRISDNAAPGGKVSGEALRQKTLRAACERTDICANRTNKPEPEPAEKPNRPMATEAMQFAVIAISQLERIREDDVLKRSALLRVRQWIDDQLPNVEEPANLTPAKAARHEIARKILKPCAEKAITAAVGAGLDKALHLGDDFSVALSTSAGSGKLLVAEVAFKKIGGT